MITRTDLLSYLDTLLSPAEFKDYCPNGLQVAGCEEIATIVTGVTASQALLDAAVALNADAVLVHHGYFWKGEAPEVVGIKQRRLKTLLLNDMNLITYHLPLDWHKTLGNNVQLAALLGWDVAGEVANTSTPNFALWTQLKSPQTAAELAQKMTAVFNRAPLVIAGHDREIKTIGWCSGGAEGFIEQAAAQGLDAYMSGEISEQTTHLARELGITYFAAGHHATERCGIKALGEHVATRYDLTHHFVDIDNPV